MNPFVGAGKISKSGMDLTDKPRQDASIPMSSPESSTVAVESNRDRVSALRWRILEARDSETDGRRFIELVQRGKLILSVAEADLQASAALLGDQHATTWHFRLALEEGQKSWDQLTAEFGADAVNSALAQPPIATLEIGSRDERTHTVLIAIGGKAYRVERVEGSAPAPVQFRLTRLPRGEHDPYYVCKLAEGSHQCDCADWFFRDDPKSPPTCKHVKALISLGWI